MNGTCVASAQKIVLDVGGAHYSTSRSTLTKYPDSMLGVMFSGRHDLDSMKSSDGSFFIDRDGAHFQYILDYLRDGEEVVRSFPKSCEVLLGLLREAKYYQLEGLVSTIGMYLCEFDVVSQNDISVDFKRNTKNMHFECDYSHAVKVNCVYARRSAGTISYEHKNMRGLSFESIRFTYPVSFVGCDLSFACFNQCFFESDVIFEDCILDDTVFSQINGIVVHKAGKEYVLTDFHDVSFAGSKTDMTNFDDTLRKVLKASGKIK